MLLLLDITVLLLLEIVEASQMKGKNLKEAVLHQYQLYGYTHFSFFILHGSLFYVLYYIYRYETWEGWMLLLAVVKIADLLLKLYLFLKLERASPKDKALFEALEGVPIDRYLRYSGCVVYPMMMGLGLGLF